MSEHGLEGLIVGQERKILNILHAFDVHILFILKVLQRLLLDHVLHLSLHVYQLLLLPKHVGAQQLWLHCGSTLMLDRVLAVLLAIAGG